MPYEQFDRSKLRLLPLEKRVHDLNNSVVKPLDESIVWSSDPVYDKLARTLVEAKRARAACILMYGAHVIRTGNALHMIALMEQGLVTHFATNGAGAIHDFELSMIGATCESVARYISEGQFGLWKETSLFNNAVNEGCKDGLGMGEAVGRYIWEHNFPYRRQSVLAMGYHLGVPCTVHVGIGCDIVHEHPNFDPAATGTASYRDFLTYTQSIMNLERGCFLNFGSAVIGPEVYLKALAMARNVAKQNGESIRDFTTAVFDLHPIETPDEAPQKTNPDYYFRPWKTILYRTVADGGKSYYVCASHDISLPNLARRALKQEQENEQ